LKFIFNFTKPQKQTAGRNFEEAEAFRFAGRGS